MNHVGTLRIDYMGKTGAVFHCIHLAHHKVGTANDVVVTIPASSGAAVHHPSVFAGAGET